jgi:hypothetical protein
MHRFLRTVAVFLLVAGALASGAPAKEMDLSLTTRPPSGIDPGETWNATLTIHTDEHMRRLMAENHSSPFVTVANERTGERIVYRAKRVGRTDEWRAGVIFPRAGEWVWEVQDGFGDRIWYREYITVGNPVVAAPTAAPRPAAPEAGSVPAWPFAAGAGVLLALGAAAFGARRLRPGRAVGRAS